MGLEQQWWESTESLENLISKWLLTDWLRKLLSEEYFKKRESGIEISLEDAYKQWIFSLLNTEWISKEQISKNQALVNLLKRFFQEIKNISEENKDVLEEVRSLFINFFMSKIDDLQLGEKELYSKCEKFYQDTIWKFVQSENPKNVRCIVEFFVSYLEWYENYVREMKKQSNVSTTQADLWKTLNSSTETLNIVGSYKGWMNYLGMEKNEEIKKKWEVFIKMIDFKKIGKVQMKIYNDKKKVDAEIEKLPERIFRILYRKSYLPDYNFEWEKSPEWSIRILDNDSFEAFCDIKRCMGLNHIKWEDIDGFLIPINDAIIHFKNEIMKSNGGFPIEESPKWMEYN